MCDDLATGDVGHENGGAGSDADDGDGTVPLAAPHKEFVHPVSEGKRYFAVGMFCVVAALLYADQNLMAPNLTQMADEFGFNETVSRTFQVDCWLRSVHGRHQIISSTTPDADECCAAAQAHLHAAMKPHLRARLACYAWKH